MSLSQRYVYKEKLGKGAYGVLAKYVDKDTKCVVAMKTMQIFTKTEDEDTEEDILIHTKRIIRELFILRGCAHQHIIHLFDIIPVGDAKTCTQVRVAMELMETDLRAVFKSGRQITPANVESWSYQILSGLRYLRNTGIVHRDLKPANLLLNLSNDVVKIADFGLSKWLIVPSVLAETAEKIPNLSKKWRQIPPLIRKNTRYMVTRWYRAPEIIFEREIGLEELKKHPGEPKFDYDFASDMWSFGLIVLEMLYRAAGLDMDCHQGYNSDDQLLRIFNLVGTAEDLNFIKNETTIRMLINRDVMKYPSTRLENRIQRLREIFENKNLSPGEMKKIENAFDLVGKCLRINPTQRLTPEQALTHDFMRDVAEANFEFKKPTFESLRTEGVITESDAAVIRVHQLDQERIVNRDVCRLYFVEGATGFPEMKKALLPVVSAPATVIATSSSEKKEGETKEEVKTKGPTPEPAKPIAAPAGSTASSKFRFRWPWSHRVEQPDYIQLHESHGIEFGKRI